MLLKIWNFTGNPIPGYVSPNPTVADRFSIKSLRNQTTPTVEPSRFLVQPYVDFSTTLPKGCCREITLLPHGNPTINQAEITSGQVEGQSSQQVDPPGLQIKLSVRNWKVVPAVEGSPWRMFLVNVLLGLNFFQGLNHSHSFVLGFTHRTQTYGLSATRYCIILVINA